MLPVFFVAIEILTIRSWKDTCSFKFHVCRYWEALVPPRSRNRLERASPRSTLEQRPFLSSVWTTFFFEAFSLDWIDDIRLSQKATGNLQTMSSPLLAGSHTSHDCASTPRDLASLGNKISRGAKKQGTRNATSVR